ncbi:protein adenylyltransferase SelO [Oryzibacter oryziterrae]|uniref:protein adenylyltransferase SelO n=1 Tax=Oryzibacter oryziterrae TaxID=2766474 RepID=UPI001F437555|nr:YdiU family protein [Oryzibacter oryziterrae]
MTLSVAFDNTYVRLPDRFFAPAIPEPAVSPRLVALNRPLAQELMLDPDALQSEQGLAMLSGNQIFEGSEPIAMAYAGHQFGNFVPQLGDGRAILLGEIIDRNGKRRDIQLKGAGRTAFSRRGDGRAALGPVLREYIVSEAMAALGVPTTRALAAVLTGSSVYRERVLPGAVITRVALSHVRVGTFQYFAARKDTEALGLLADHVIARLYPEAASEAVPALALFKAIATRQADLIARWINVGFIHGVMNTDNMAISGETIDYGPCAFMDAYDPSMVLSSIDQGGRYAYGNQPRIAQWNLARLAECLLPLIVPALGEKPAMDAVMEILNDYSSTFEQCYQNGLGEKLGLTEAQEGDLDLVKVWLEAMRTGNADFTLAFRRLADCAVASDADGALFDLFESRDAIAPWLDTWRHRLAGQQRSAEETRRAMRRINPAFIPRNHLLEEIIEAAIERDDFAPFDRLHQILSRPFEDQPDAERQAMPPKPHERVMATFCGT